jgi:bacterioferritin
MEEKMGETAQKIIKVNKTELLKILNEAYAEEWLAYYQYWLGAKVAAGAMRASIVKEFEEHSKEEHEHATMIANRIIELGGTPLLSPSDWEKKAHCKYDAPKDECSIHLVKDNLKSERCAIQRYQNLADMCFGKDHKTYSIAVHILKEEIEHEQEMEDFLTDLDMMKNKCMK